MLVKINPKAIKRGMAKQCIGPLGLAREAGLSGETVSKTLKKGHCLIQTAGMIAKALNVEPEEIMEEGEL